MDWHVRYIFSDRRCRLQLYKLVVSVYLMISEGGQAAAASLVNTSSFVYLFNDHRLPWGFSETWAHATAWEVGWCRFNVDCKREETDHRIMIYTSIG